MSYARYKTIGDLVAATYGRNYNELMKGDAPVITTTTGVANDVYGAHIWAQLNHEANAFGVLPKYAWNKSGWRVMSARMSTGTHGGVAENAAIPDSQKPTFAVQSTDPKTVANVFDMSEVANALATDAAGDDYSPSMEELRRIEGIEHKEQMNRMLLTDVETLASNNIDSIDRVCSNYSESALLSAATDSDMYGDTLRSSSASWKDAYVSHNSDTDRNLTDAVYRTALFGVAEQGANSTLSMTGYDTYAKLIGLYDQRVVYDVIDKKEFKVGVNGIQTQNGVGVGIRVSTIYGLPLIVSKDCPSDGISRIYILDTSDPAMVGEPRLGLKILRPTQYFEAGMTKGDPFGIDKLGDQGMYRTMGELICTHFKAQCKIRDLQ